VAKRERHSFIVNYGPSIHAFMGLSIINQLSMSTECGCMANTNRHCCLQLRKMGTSKRFQLPLCMSKVRQRRDGVFSFKNLRRHVTQESIVCMISDRHESIKRAFNDPQNGWQETCSIHVYCIQQIKQNFIRKSRMEILWM